MSVSVLCPVGRGGTRRVSFGLRSASAVFDKSVRQLAVISSVAKRSREISNTLNAIEIPRLHSGGSHHLWWWSFHMALPFVSDSISLWERVRVRVSGRRRCAPHTPALSPGEREEIPSLSAPPSRGLPEATRSAGGVSLGMTWWNCFIPRIPRPSVSASLRRD